MLVDLSNPEHYALVLSKAKQVHNGHRRAMAAAGEEYEDYVQRLCLSVMEHPLEYIDKKVWSRAVSTFWRAPAQVLVSNERGNQLSIRFLYDIWREHRVRFEWSNFHELMVDSLPWPEPEPHVEELSSIQHALAKLETLWVDLENPPSFRAAAYALLEDCGQATAAELFGVSKQAANQARQKILRNINEDIKLLELAA